MYLKKIEIQGFKSFAEKISLEFNSGITSIIGPNGSGKSNISDAVRWVLGEQSAKTLRGSKMEDVIFAGTEHRKPLGFAEVSLTVDNSDNALPLEFNEITVTRRVFRSGESEYYINKTPCRLKDIHSLFMDTGIGRDGYSIIGQGRVDEILSTKSEDRRGIFEEAAGIMKYKVRKLESERKLELTRQNLVRINDIINELEIQLEPLRQQSETARKYLKLRDELKHIEVNVYLETITRLKESMQGYEKEYLSVKENVDAENKKLEDVTKANRYKAESLKVLEEKLESSKKEFYDIDGKVEKANSEIKLNNERVNNLSKDIARLENEITEINSKIHIFSEDIDSKNNKLEYLNSQYEDYNKKLQEHEKKLEQILSTLDENEKYIESLKSEIMDKMDLLSDKKVQMNNVKIHLENLKKRQAGIDLEKKQIILEIDRENIKREDFLQSIHTADENLKKSKREVEKLSSRKKEVLGHLNNKRNSQNNLKSQIQFKTSRYNMLVDMEKNLEGYNRSVKHVLEACRQSNDFGKGIRGALAQLISVEEKYETAIEMALGGSLQNIVSDTEKDAKKAIEYLKSRKLGRATFLPLTSVKGRSLENNIMNEIKKHNGYCGIASEIIGYHSDYRNIILNLLGRVVVVENLDSGIALARKFGYSFRIVTIEGDILSTSGSMTGGSLENRGTGILSRSREIKAIKNELDNLAVEESYLENEIKKLLECIDEIDKNILFEEENIKNNELVKVRDESYLSQTISNVEKHYAKVEMLTQEKNQLIRQEKDISAEIDKYLEEITLMEKGIDDTKRVISQHQEKYKKEQTSRDLLHQDITDYKISVNSIKESIQTTMDSIERISLEKDAALKSIQKRNNEKQKISREIKTLFDTNQGLQITLKKINEEKIGKSFQIEKFTEEKKVLEEELQQEVEEIAVINKNIVLLQEELSRFQIKKARMDADLESVQNRLWEEYELTFTNALQMKQEIDNLSQAQKKINQIKNEIKELGNVNVTAIDDYVKTKERYEFMTTQKNDMEQAEIKLQKVIHEITSIMKKRFMEQFKLINENFNVVFRELFGGGKAELKLSDEHNILESGIDIEVQPPGKKLQNMMLLSGGERAFTAIALLFSILLLKPAPFCILDEIESALDDANVYRFAEYVKKFSQNTQFIMVTHRKGTMESSDTLYGVTMQEHGISKVVSIKLTGEKAG